MKASAKIIMPIILILFFAGIIYVLSLNQSHCIKLTEKRTINPSLPGAVLPPLEIPGSIDKKVNQDNIQQTICVPGYTKSVRPSVSFTNKIKIGIMQEMGLTDSPSDYELDHLVSLELGGCPDSTDNLWLESYLTTPNAKDKDKLENYLHKQVCNGKIKLMQAQTEIATDWYSAYKKYGLS